MRSTTLLLLATLSHALVAPRTRAVASAARRSPAPLSEAPRSETRLAALPDEDELFGGYTAKQRLREEIDSPFRKVRLLFFGASTGSAGLAFYFSLLNAFKANAGFRDAPPLSDALQSCGINLVAIVACAAVTYNDWRAGQANLERIAQGGRLAKLVVSPAAAPEKRAPLADYRRTSRVVIACGGRAYVETLARRLSADQRPDANTLPEAIESVDMVVVPVLLEAGGLRVGDAAAAWRSTEAGENDRNFDVARSAGVVAFPRGPDAWADYLASEIETASSQGFDPVAKGLTIIIKKNGRVLRRVSGLPPFDGLIGTMEVADGSKFGMPGDDQRASSATPRS
ncbi:DUF3493-containing protein [Aureococcus anophagefferens]|uniref:Uncharacterized protein n=1 Tax=Aureococcus anophagefferens TaxID=44056 RepID=F0Y6L7_AURAN|nr:hypothetical protein AURANDRAFT_63641 [Aureococcus anophagefferens]EGB09156.1 hypothetical protein AURANDRAFT_63641 [Aureococcus anophagefferens]KAH8099138.1 DUF3493-containing protein [Aureococcus anophagefferens]|eukprot:XP_009036267.1 hypothetical protein AURANDRAFT_63641 [Aureococcus anophagefferens]